MGLEIGYYFDRLIVVKEKGFADLDFSDSVLSGPADLERRLPSNCKVTCRRKDRIVSNTMITKPRHVDSSQHISPRRCNIASFKNTKAEKIVWEVLSKSPILLNSRFGPVALLIVPGIAWKIGENHLQAGWVRYLDAKRVQLTHGLQEGNGVILTATEDGYIIDSLGDFFVNLPQRTSKSCMRSNLQMYGTFFRPGEKRSRCGMEQDWALRVVLPISGTEVRSFVENLCCDTRIEWDLRCAR